MVFVPIPGTKTLFCSWDTRVQDYAAYAAAAPGIDPSWRKVEYHSVPVSGAPNHPVTKVSWDDAHKFCRWLTLKEQQARLISAEQFYRLPTDAEWSKAVGLGNENEGLPVSKANRIKDLYPWGTSWPPTNAVGNFADRAAKGSFKDMLVIRNYDDGFPTTSPVGRFPANRYGLYDMTGNVWQWCEDWFDSGRSNHVARGASWHSSEPRRLLSSHRSGVPEGRDSSLGFRCILATGEPF
jgi:formylglycine-generating enzyme required for sulfatase activity